MPRKSEVVFHLTWWNAASKISVYTPMSGGVRGCKGSYKSDTGGAESELGFFIPAIFRDDSRWL